MTTTVTKAHLDVLVGASYELEVPGFSDLSSDQRGQLLAEELQIDISYTFEPPMRGFDRPKVKAAVFGLLTTIENDGATPFTVAFTSALLEKLADIQTSANAQAWHPEKLADCVLPGRKKKTASA